MFLLHALPTRQSTPSCFSSIALYPSIMDPIVEHPAIAALSINVRPRSRLKERHKYLFDGTHRTDASSSTQSLLFDELALVACTTGVVPRKELFETYAAATVIHAKFPHMKRMADLAAGHGLLSWFLLALDLYEVDDTYSFNVNSIYNASSTTHNPRTGVQSRPRTVVCVDRRMPPSADVIASAMINRFPELEERWSYIQSDLSAVVPHPSCLMTSVHACGTLTDYLIEMAIGADSFGGADNQSDEVLGAPLAIVPCCHTVKERNGYRPHHLSGMCVEEVAALVEERKKKQDNLKHEAVADVVDEVRCQTLRNAGYDVEEVMLPKAFTGRNRVLLGEPNAPAPSSTAATTPGADDLVRRTNGKSSDFFQRQLGDIMSTTRMRIPLADDHESIAHCQEVSGRERAAKRLITQIPRHFSPSLVMSIWLLDASTSKKRRSHEVLSVETLQAFADQCCGEFEVKEIQCKVGGFGGVNVQSTTGRRSQLYRFTYNTPEGTDLILANVSRVNAKRIDGMIRERIVFTFGDVLR